METRQGLSAPQRPRADYCSFRAGHCALLLFAFVLLGGCASPGEPIERKPPVPQPVTDLAAVQFGNSVVLTFALPKETVDRRSLDHPPAIEIFRDFEPSAGTAALHPTLHATIPSAVVDNYSEQDRIRYTDPLQPEDFTQHRDSTVVYIVRTRASAKKESEDSNAVTVRVHPAPDAIDDLRAEVTRSGIQITWMPPQQTPVGAAPPISGYRIYRAESPLDAAHAATANPPVAPLEGALRLPSPATKIGETETASYLDTQFELGKTYVYSVRSVVTYGDEQIESADSNPLAVLARDISPPATPRDLIVVYVPAHNNVASHLELSWSISAETDTAGYNVYRSEQAGAPGARANIELLLTPAFRDMNVTPDRDYFYRVTAVDRSGNESPASTVVSGAVPAESQPTP
jgi:hypothetical protein